MSASTKKAKLPVKVLERAKAVVQPSKPVLVVKPQPNEQKAKLVAALKRLHPMD
jgi:hypothetical protein